MFHVERCLVSRRCLRRLLNHLGVGPAGAAGFRYGACGAYSAARWGNRAERPRATGGGERRG